MLSAIAAHPGPVHARTTWWSAPGVWQAILPADEVLDLWALFAFPQLYWHNPDALQLLHFHNLSLAKSHC